MPTGDGIPRIYIISTDTENGVINHRMLKAELDADAGVPALRTGANGGWADTDANTGELRLWSGATLSAAEKTAQDAVVLAHTGTITLRTWQKWESNPRQSTTLETWQNALVRTTQPLTEGIYRIQWNLELRIVSTDAMNSLAVARFNFNGDTPEGFYCHAQEEWCGFSGWDFATLAEGNTPELKVQFRRDPGVAGDDTIEIRRVKFCLERMG